MKYSISSSNGDVHLQIGNTSFNVNQMLDVTKEKFIKDYSSLLDVNEAWPILQEEVKKLKDVREPKKKGK